MVASGCLALAFNRRSCNSVRLWWWVSRSSNVLMLVLVVTVVGWASGYFWLSSVDFCCSFRWDELLQLARGINCFDGWLLTSPLLTSSAFSSFMCLINTASCSLSWCMFMHRNYSMPELFLFPVDTHHYCQQWVRLFFRVLKILSYRKRVLEMKVLNSSSSYHLLLARGHDAFCTVCKFYF